MPWAREGSGLTLMMEAFMMLLSAEMPVNAMADLLDEPCVSSAVAALAAALNHSVQTQAYLSHGLQSWLTAIPSSLLELPCPERNQPLFPSKIPCDAGGMPAAH